MAMGAVHLCDHRVDRHHLVLPRRSVVAVEVFADDREQSIIGDALVMIDAKALLADRTVDRKHARLGP
jgi:hypothetical protein